MRNRGRLAVLLLGLGLGSCGPPAAAPAPAAGESSPGVVALVDGEGFFVASLTGEVHPGPGIGCLLREPGEGELIGRLADGEAAVTLYRRSEDGSFDALGVVREPASEPLRPRFMAALRGVPPADRTHPVAREFGEILRGAGLYGHADVYEEPAPPDRGGPWPFPGPPSPGASLADWAADDEVYVHFRSVEAAYRFSGLANEVAGHLLRVTGDGRDYRTLWLGLHQLTLPMVWRTNPGAERGVSEAGLVIEAGERAWSRRGDARFALLLRVIRSDLHESQTRVGLALAAREDHRWLPASDPFPRLRDPTGRRRTAGDVEVVSVGLERDVAAGVGRSTSYAAAVAAARSAADTEPPPGQRAVFVYVPGRAAQPATTRAYAASMRAYRQTQGLRALSFRLSGVSFDPPPFEHYASEPATDPFAGLRWLDVHTDARGATVRIEARDGTVAQRIAHALSAPPLDAAAATRVCGRNLSDVFPVALVERRKPDLAERCFVWLGWAPVCPCGGTYRAHPITGTPSCSLHGSLDEPREAGAAPRSPVESIERNDDRVTFRLAIDWSRRE